jgi:hypothetical protein
MHSSVVQHSIRLQALFTLFWALLVVSACYVPTSLHFSSISECKSLIFSSYKYKEWEPGSSVSSVWLRIWRPGDRGSISGRGERIFPVTSVSRPALEPTQPPVQWIERVLSPGLKRGRGVTLTTHPYLAHAALLLTYQRCKWWHS